MGGRFPVRLRGRVRVHGGHTDGINDPLVRDEWNNGTSCQLLLMEGEGIVYNETLPSTLINGL